MAGKCDSTEDFIEFYRREQCLWNSKSDAYKDRSQKQESMKRMCETLGMTESEVKGKINSLRTYYTRELSKHTASLATDQKYESKWPHFKTLNFLKETVLARKCFFSTGSNRTFVDTDVKDALDRNVEGMDFLPTMCSSTIPPTVTAERPCSVGIKRKLDDTTTVTDIVIEHSSETRAVSSDDDDSVHALLDRRLIDTDDTEQNESNIVECQVKSTSNKKAFHTRRAPVQSMTACNINQTQASRFSDYHCSSNDNRTYGAKDSRTDGPCEVFAQHVTYGLRNIENDMARQWAMLKIQETLFQAQYDKEFVPSKYTTSDSTNISTNSKNQNKD